MHKHYLMVWPSPVIGSFWIRWSSHYAQDTKQREDLGNAINWPGTVDESLEIRKISDSPIFQLCFEDNSKIEKHFKWKRRWHALQQYNVQLLHYFILDSIYRWLIAAAASPQISLFEGISQYWLGCYQKKQTPSTQWFRGTKLHISHHLPFEVCWGWEQPWPRVFEGCFSIESLGDVSHWQLHTLAHK